MIPYDCERIGEMLQAKILIPCLYDNWENTTGDPTVMVDEFERIVKENIQDIKTATILCGGNFTYTDDQDITYIVIQILAKNMMLLDPCLMVNMLKC